MRRDLHLPSSTGLKSVQSWLGTKVFLSLDQPQRWETNEQYKETPGQLQMYCGILEPDGSSPRAARSLNLPSEATWFCGAMRTYHGESFHSEVRSCASVISEALSQVVMITFQNPAHTGLHRSLLENKVQL